MRIINVEYEHKSSRYTLELEHNNVRWFMFLGEYVHKDPKKFQAWLNSLINEAKIRT